jgi:hypothetical protein
MGEARADVPPVVSGDLGHRQLPRMQADGAVTNSLIPLDRVAALTATVALGAAQKPGRAVGIDTQRAATTGLNGVAVAVAACS